MKTIKEAAAEYAARTDKANAEWVMADFTAGVEFVQRWISAGKELPPIRREGHLSDSVLVKLKTGRREVARYNYETERFNHRERVFLKNEITHWRPIELK
ncbi:MAG: hypothetical protein LBD80_09330 [Tannerella sp.]|jgi:hypothetical protein|nr:hypothetical protein [Tannerella sp.]